MLDQSRIQQPRKNALPAKNAQAEIREILVKDYDYHSVRRGGDLARGRHHSKKAEDMLFRQMMELDIVMSPASGRTPSTRMGYESCALQGVNSTFERKREMYKYGYVPRKE